MARDIRVVITRKDPATAELVAHDFDFGKQCIPPQALTTHGTCPFFYGPMRMNRAIPRKIIFCVDIDHEMDDMIGPSIDGSVQQSMVVTSSRLDTIKLLIKRYMLMNSWISPSDMYAVIIMGDRASWYMDFTQDPMLLATAIDELHTQVFKPAFCADSLFEVIERHTDLVNPSVYTHAIVFYGRTHVVPTCRTAVGPGICANPRFSLDLLFLHESIRNDRGTCQAVFDFWIQLSQRGWFYEFAKLGRSSLTKAMAQLTAHPLQRGDQDRIAQPFQETISLIED